MVEENKYRFEYQDVVNANDVLILSAGKSRDAYLKKKMDPLKFFGIFIKNKAGEVLGGITFYTYYGCLHIDMLYVREELRGQGLGRKLVLDAEKVGLKNGSLFATVSTMDFEAPLFYEKLGYEMEFIREGFQNNSKMYIFRKKISQS